jgi:hypothetical protein
MYTCTCIPIQKSRRLDAALGMVLQYRLSLARKTIRPSFHLYIQTHTHTQTQAQTHTHTHTLTHTHTFCI